MLQKIIGKAMLNKTMKRMMSGPQNMLPLSPGKGTGNQIKRAPMPKKLKSFVVRKQNPAFTPNTGGLVRPRRMR